METDVWWWGICVCNKCVGYRRNEGTADEGIRRKINKLRRAEGRMCVKGEGVGGERRQLKISDQVFDPDS